MLPLFFMALELLVCTLWRFVLVGDQFAGKVEAKNDGGRPPYEI